MVEKEMFTLLLLILVVPVHLQEGCEEGYCHPSLGDLMVGRAAQLSATSTCGLNGPQKYCILGYLEDEQKCFTCDSRSPYNRYNNRHSHQIENIITIFETERKMRWWQSENGVHQVSIQLDLETMFQFSHLVLTFKSFRPAAMLVERSRDFGRSWKVFRYFAADCANDFPRVSVGPADSIDDLICDSRYSGAEPSTDGEVVLKALDPSFHIDDPYNPTVQELTTITNLRVNFTRLLTLGDNLLARRRRNPQEKYYYALYEMLVKGRCFCNGHASECVPVFGTRGDVYSEPGMIHGRCVCHHNTVGVNCEKCLDFYNDAPWRPARHTNPHVCKKCNCNGHSEQCHFDENRYRATGQVSGGVCDNCRNNRMGAQCEQCLRGFYRDSRRSLEDPAACIPCACNPAGTVDGGLCHPTTGQCLCKQNIEGEQCDRCKISFYGLGKGDPNGCQRCRCNFLGTIKTSPCDQTTGRCNCESFALGPECNQCVPGYWGLGNTVFGCLPCKCDIGGSFSTVCSSTNGQCQCRANMMGRSCNEPAPGYFLAPLDFYLYEAENAAALDTKCSSYLVRPSVSDPTPRSTPLPYCPHGSSVQEPTPAPHYPTQPVQQPSRPPHSTPARLSRPPFPIPLLPTSPPDKHVTMPKCEQYFRSRGYDFTFSEGRFVVVKHEKRQKRKRRQGERTISLEPGSTHQIILRTHSPDLPAAWTGLGFVQVQDGAGLRFTVTNTPLTLNYHLVIRYEPQSTDDWAARVKISSLGPYDENCPYDPSEKTLALPSTGRAAILDLPVCLSTGVRYHMDITFEKQGSPDPYCRSHILIDSMGLIPKMESLQNFCSQEDLAKYQQFRCMELSAQARERTLPEACEGLVASMSAYVHNGAIPCRCNSQGSFSSSCSKFGGQCDCKPNVIGRCCDTCAPLTFGFGPNGCSSCDCEPSGSKAEFCDYKTGQCPCRNDISGRRCDRCLPGYYGFPNCRRCRCHGLAERCDPVTGDCLNCREHSSGPHCERCVEGYFGDPVSRVPCKPCRCPEVIGSGRFFALSCSMDPNSVVQTCECERGHAGLFCDMCAPGYYGNLRLAGGGCKQCHCNGNINPNDVEACDGVTGKCLRCLYNTHGHHCETCKPGYYGNALLQDCKECSCDRRGTENSQCPQNGPCLCNKETGQCPCRTGVVGAFCDRCEDGYWNLNGVSGCQLCNCDVEHSLSNVCDKITGQCPCGSEYGGKRCDECAANHFGNPDIQCISCDCNMEGSIYPGCDPYTGECMCRSGVSGTFCDKCAPGHEADFPACRPCHQCFSLWEKHVKSISEKAKEILSLIPPPGEGLMPGDVRLEELQEKLEMLVRMINRDRDELGSLEKLINDLRNMSETIDPNIIIIDPSQLLDTDIDNIRYEFKRLLDDLQRKIKDASKIDLSALNDTLGKIQKHHTDFLKDEQRVNEAKNITEASREIRQKTKQELAKCELRPLDILDKKIKTLSVVKLNEEICGAPGDVACANAPCGGALCGKCGGPSCTGSLPVSQTASDTAQRTDTGVQEMLRNLTEVDTKIKEVKIMNADLKDKAQNMMKKINSTKDRFEKEKIGTKNLIKRIMDYLREETMDPKDIDTLANAVLAIQLPESPEEIKKKLQDIQKLLANFTHDVEDLKNLENQINLAKDLRIQAEAIMNKTKDIDVSEIQKDLNDTAQLNDKTKKYLNETERNQSIINEKLSQGKIKLNNVEDSLNSSQTTKLLEEIEALKNKTEINRAQAEEANATANAALANSTDAEKVLIKVEEQFKRLTEKNKTQGANEDASERLKNLKNEAVNMAKDIENKITQIEDLERRIRNSEQSKEMKTRELETLLEQAESLRAYISGKVENYFKCLT